MMANDVEVGCNMVYDVNQAVYDYQGAGYCPQDPCGGDVVQLVTGNNFHIHHNILNKSNEGNKFNIIVSTSDINNYRNTGLKIEHNELYGPSTIGSGGTAISIWGFDNTTIVRYNKIFAPHSAAIYVESSYGGSYYGNIFEGWNGETFYIAPWNNVGDVKLYNNIFFNPTPGYSVIRYGTGTIQVRNNIFMTPAGTDIITATGTVQGSNNLFLNNPADIFGSNNIIGSPLFVNQAGKDFHLSSGSPAINNGTMVGLPHNPPADMDGTLIPQGVAPDISAYEWH
jgi:hypothetical protein